MRLVRPAHHHLAAYRAALQRGWSPDNLRGAAAAAEQLAQIEADADAFLALSDDPEGQGPLVTLPDGSTVKRLPSLRRWMWHEGRFVGSIGLRWQAGTPELPPHCLGHIGYAVVPWAQRQGHATQALRLMLEEARRVGLPHVDITTDLDNQASQRVMQRAGARLVETFTKPAAFGSTPGVLYRIELGGVPRVMPIAEAHVEGFHACLDEVAREQRFLAQLQAPPLGQVAAFVRDGVRNDAAQFVALDDAGQVVGWADIFPAWPATTRHVGTLGMGVRPGWRGRGLGQRLLAACIAKAERQGITRIELSARADNAEALRLYQRLGFRHEGTEACGMRFGEHYFDTARMSLLVGDADVQDPEPAP